MAYPDILGGVISTNNSSTSTLGSGAAFTGTADEITRYASVSVYVFSNVASATDGLSLQQSNDGTNWDVLDVFTYQTGAGRTYGVQATARYFRVVYTNSGSAQGSFRLQTILHTYMERTSSVRPQDARSNENDMTETVAYAALFNGTTWDRMRGDTTNGLDVDVTRQPARARTTDAIATADQTDAVMNGTTALTPKFAIISASASGNTSVVALVASKKIRVLAANFMANGTVNVKFQSNTTDKTGLKYLVVNTGMVLPYCKTGWFETAAGEALNINLSAAIAVGGELVYIEV